MFLHHGAKRGIPTSVRVSEEINCLTGVFFQFSLAVSDLVPRLFRRQGRQYGMADAVRAEIESLLSKARPPAANRAMSAGRSSRRPDPPSCSFHRKAPSTRKVVAGSFSCRSTGAAEE